MIWAPGSRDPSPGSSGLLEAAVVPQSGLSHAQSASPQVWLPISQLSGASVIPTPGHLQNEDIRPGGHLLTSPKRIPLSLEQSRGAVGVKLRGPPCSAVLSPRGLRGTQL